VVRFGFVVMVAALPVAARASLAAAILAGGETAAPEDAPSRRLDAGGEFPYVGALEIRGNSGVCKGSAVAISDRWLLSAGHNADLDDDGLPDAGWSADFHLPGFGVFSVEKALVHPDFGGFANPSVNDDLSLLYLATPLPAGLGYPSLGSAGVGDLVTLVGFGRSGYGSYGYTTNASLTDRRGGANVIDTLSPDDEGAGVPEVFRYDFDDPATTGQPGGSLGNDVETIIGPGDSGGAALRRTSTGGWELVGVNTFTEGYGGRFGDTGGGVLVAPYEDWIAETTGVPEPSVGAMLVFGAGVLFRRRRSFICPLAP
jgi:hypothetical protein